MNFDENLISKFNGENILITSDSFNLLNRTYDVVNQNNKLVNVTVYTQSALTSIKFLENWNRIPLALYLPSMGSYRMFFHMLPVLRQMNLRIYLPVSNNQNIIDVQMMASLGIFAGIYFDKKPINWEKVKELAFYSQYSKSQHAPVEPFHHISSKYKSDETLDFNAVYYNDPNQFLHINNEGKVALTYQLLKEGKFALESYLQINTLKENEDFVNYNTAWQRHFLDKTTCSYCPAWRICMGKFESSIDAEKSCQQLFVEVLEGAENHQEKNKRKPEKVWQL